MKDATAIADNEDKDNDGDSENDDDLVGQTVDWTNVPPGEYEIALTVTNDVGMTDSDTIRVYVSYAGYGSDFEIGANSTSGTSNACRPTTQSRRRHRHHTV